MTTRRTLLGAGLAALPGAASAQSDWPSRPVRTVVPYPPGGPNDIIARLYAPALSAALKGNVVVENRAGGSGVVGVEYVLQSPADGYTLCCMDGGALTISPHSRPSTMPYKVPDDVGLVTPVAFVPEALVAWPGLGVKTLPELLELAKKKPGTLNIGTAGSGGGISQLAAYLFKILTGAAVEVVPYRGAAPAITDLVAGQVQLLFADLPPLLPHIQSGGLTPLALAAKQRSPTLPNLATTAEYGFPRMLAENWYCTVAPKATPAPIIEKLSAAYRQASGTGDLKVGLAQQGVQPGWMSVPDFARFITEDSAFWAEVVKSSGVKFE